MKPATPVLSGSRLAFMFMLSPAFAKFLSLVSFISFPPDALATVETMLVSIRNAVATDSAILFIFSFFI
ncbi:hypothetical protein DW015_10865 [Ruminococcus sp. AF37-20]|nr:hypothetical protein DW015_10865 [Ruminococcus sp. AF37-20]